MGGGGFGDVSSGWVGEMGSGTGNLMALGVGCDGRNVFAFRFLIPGVCAGVGLKAGGGGGGG